MSGSDQKNEEVSLQNTENTQIQKEDEDIPPPPLDDDEPMSSEVRLPHPTVIYRSSWGAQAPRGEMEELKLPMEEVLITFTGTDECLTNHECLDAVDLIQRRDIQGRGLADIQYKGMLEEPLQVIRRKDWGAKKYVVGLLPVIPPVQYVVVHFYTGSRGCFSQNTCKDYVKKLQRRAVKERKLADIPFSFLISPNEEIYEGRGWDVTSEKTLPYTLEWGNKYDVAFIGNYLDVKPSPGMIRQLVRLIWYGIDRENIDYIYNRVKQVRDKKIRLF
ncbi:uncharacterized protein LOC128986248 isoform X2 [Macrosteles quadrilineatus]|uniref:uncharacterized protein LOC128986248 isoform X2 n=1 Tax=Macrosteles quadrilineatus TaxID=74068 RepID=UPI0023E17021|nr:uncharacterized protein LOC128986248 isoform X2 [Macrosteles quadrilineatus]